LSIAGSLTGAGAAKIQGTLDVAEVQGFTGTIDISGPRTSPVFSGTLRLHQGGLPGGLVNMNGGTVDLLGVPSTGTVLGYDRSSGLLTLGTAVLDVGAGLSLVDFSATSDGAGGTLVTQTGTASSSIAPDTIDGAVTLNDGGWWTQTTIQVAPTSFGNTSNTLAVAASPSSLPTTLDAQQIMLGLDGSIDIPGTFKSGTLEISGGSAVRAETVTLAQNGIITLDTTSTLVIGGGLPSAGLVTVGSAGTLRVERGSINTGVSLDGSLWVSEAFVIGLVPGSLSIAGSLTGAGTVDIQGTLDVADAQGFTGTIDVSGHPGSIIFSGTLRLHQGGLANGLVKMDGGTLDLPDVPYSGATAQYDPVTGELTVGGVMMDVGAGSSLAHFTLLPDETGGTKVTGAALPCFAAGTSLLTPDGPRRVETLAAGDAVTVLDGTARTIRWTGQRTVDCAAHPHPAKVWPVRIAAHAFGPGLPARPLHLSPDHAV
jgi:hypothetical protein